MTGYISPRAQVSSRALIAPTACIFGSSVVGDFARIDTNVLIGYPSPSEQMSLAEGLSADRPVRDYFAHLEESVASPTHIGPRCVVRSGSVLYSGVTLEADVDVAHNVHIREDSHLGRGTRVITGAQVMASVRIGAECRIAGTLCNRSSVGDASSMLGHLTHRFRIAVSGYIEDSPSVGDGVLVGREAAVVGGITVGDYAIVAAGAVVLESVPEATIWARNPAVRVGARGEAEVDELRDHVLRARAGGS